VAHVNVTEWDTIGRFGTHFVPNETGLAQAELPCQVSDWRQIGTNGVSTRFYAHRTSRQFPVSDANAEVRRGEMTSGDPEIRARELP